MSTDCDKRDYRALAKRSRSWSKLACKFRVDNIAGERGETGYLRVIYIRPRLWGIEMCSASLFAVMYQIDNNGEHLNTLCAH